MRFSANTGLQCGKEGRRRCKHYLTIAVPPCFNVISGRDASDRFFEKLDMQIAFIFTDQDPTSQDDHQDGDPKASGTCDPIP